MKIRDVMSTDVVVIPVEATYEEATKILFDNQVSGAPVVDKEGRLVGVISDKDLYRVLFPWYKSFSEDPEEYLNFEAREMAIDEVRQEPVAGFMSKQVITTQPDEFVMRAGAIMLAERVHRLPVVEQGKLVGVVTRADIYHELIAQHLGLQSQTQRKTLKSV